MPRSMLCAALIALISATSANAAPARLVWSGLVMAENVEQPHPVPPELAKLEQTLKELFGYNQFEVIGQSQKTLKTGEEDWLAKSKYFALHVDAHGVDDAGYELKLQLYQENELLLETNTKLSERSPLVIKGPLVGGGQLLLVLVVDSDEQRKASAESERRRSSESNKLVIAWRRLSRMLRSAGH